LTSFIPWLSPGYVGQGEGSEPLFKRFPMLEGIEHAKRKPLKGFPLTFAVPTPG
jgi:hypothetical protein